MRHTARALAPTLFLFACALLCRAQPATPRPAAQPQPPPPALSLGEWKEFAPAGGGFSILFPGTPQSSTKTLKLSEQHSAELHIHSLTNPTLECSVIYADYPIPVGDPAVARAVLDYGAKGAVASVNAELLSLTEITHEGHPGRLLRERMPDGKILRAKMVLVGQRLFQVAFTTPREDGAAPQTVRHYEESADKFLDSFKLVPANLTGPTGRIGPIGPVGPVGPAHDSPAEATGPGEVDLYLTAHQGEVFGPDSGARPDAPASRPAVEVINHRAISKPAPVYPAIARAARASGVVVVRVVVDEEGGVVAAQAVGGHPLLRGASVQAARQTRFTPTLIEGKPVKIHGLITYNFNLR